MQQRNSKVGKISSWFDLIVGSSNSDQSSFHGNEIPIDVLIEVLSWLPGKSLMRFKSVSKHFHYLITHPLFMEMYQTRSYAQKGDVALLVSPRLKYRAYTWDRSFFVIHTNTMNKVSPRESIHQQPLLNSVNMRSNIVNGLICLYHQQYSPKRETYLYNLTTREILPLPKSTRATIFDGIVSCFLGFDPANKEYKVLRVWKSSRVKCDVVTVGSEDGWRPINIPHHHFGGGAIGLHRKFYYDAFCGEGVLYWTSYNSNLPHLPNLPNLPHLPNRCALMAFDVEHEKLEFIKCPTLDRTSVPVVAHIQGNLSLVQITATPINDWSSIMITLWTLTDGTDKVHPLWTKRVTTCQFPKAGQRLFGCSSSGQVFSARRPYSEECIVDCFNLENGQFSEMRVNNAHGVIGNQHYDLRLSVVVANIVSLKNLRSHMLLSLHDAHGASITSVDMISLW